MFDRSPFENITAPEFVRPFSDKIYVFPTFLAQKLNKPIDQAVYFVASFVAIGCCLILKQIRGETSKKIFSTVLGMAIHFYVFGMSAFASVSQNLLSYLMMITLPEDWQHIAVFVSSATALGFAQLHKQVYKPGVNGLDVPMSLMFNFCRVTSLVCCVRDGLKLKHQSSKNPAVLKGREVKFAIEEGIPSFFDFWAYMYFCGGVISGPWYEFKDFKNYMKGQGHYKSIPSTVVPTVRIVLQAVGLVVYGIILSIWFDERQCLTEEFKSYGILKKIWFQYWGVQIGMSKYMTGFSFMEAGPIASGLSFNGVVDGQPRHDRIKSVNVWTISTATTVKDMFANWNMSVHEWLKNYVFLRLLDSKKKGSSTFTASMTTFFVSAIWHGFYPGFFVFFAGAAFLDYQNKLQEKTLTPWLLKYVPQQVISVYNFLACFLITSFYQVAFNLLQWEAFDKVHREMYYVGHIYIVVAILACLPFSEKKERKKPK